MAEQRTVDLEALTDLCTPWCIRVVVTLRVAGRIADGIHSIDELAAQTHCDQFVLHRVMQHLVGKGIFAEPEPGRFALNEASGQLMNPGLRIGLDLNGIGGRMSHAWSTMLKYVQTGKPHYQDIYGLPFWEDLDAHPDVSASFDELIGLVGHGTPDPHFDLADGWDSIRTVVDVGGGTGSMLAEILRVRPEVRGILVDQPNTVARSSETFEAAGVSERVTTAGQSFFDELPSGADLYILRGVINDWPDEEAATILKRCADAARPNGRVVILKSVNADGAPRDLTIEMVLVGGKQRSVSEFRELARRSGLEVVAAGRNSGSYFVVECRPV